MKIIIAVLCTVQLLSSQIPHDWSHTIGDTAAPMEMHDFTIDAEGRLFVVGQKLPEGKRIFSVSAVTTAKDSVFTIGIEGPFEENGLLIAPVDALHIAAAGYFEDTTGTFNFRTMKITKEGIIVWNKEFGNDGQAIMDVPNDLEIDPFGNIVTAGNSHSLEGKYSIVHYSPSGNENWSVRHKPIDTAWTTLKDIVIDPAGNIYGITANTFVNDTTHGTIFKRDINGLLLWERTFDLMFPEKADDLLVLANDTLYAAGSLFTEGSVNGTVVCVALTSSGNVAAYRRINLPGDPVQQAVRSFTTVFDNQLVLVNESFHSGSHILHTFVLSKNFSIVFVDSTSSDVPVISHVTALGENEFAAVIAGSSMYRKVYRQNQESIAIIDEQQFLAPQKSFSHIRLSGGHIFLGSTSFDSPATTATVLRFTPQNINSVRRIASSAQDWMLLPAYPNPFNSSTVIAYHLPQTGTVTFFLYDVSGRLIRTVYRGIQTSGNYKYTLDASHLATGTYFVRMVYNEKSQLQKIVYIK
ncbi:MAG: T9SS type A sorting domain-containing protein [Bacteroidota bacterium]